MKLETILLHGLFVACLVSCVLAMAGMLSAQPAPPRLAAAAVSAPHTLG